MRIAYLVSEYPKVSHSFVRREIHALEGLGFEVERFAIRGRELVLVDAEDIAERLRTRYVLGHGVWRLLSAMFAVLVGQPRRFVESLRLAFGMARRADRSLPYHLIYFLEACWVSRWLISRNIEHLHAHFGTNPAEVAMLVHALTEIPYSFTVHGPEEFDKPEFLHLREKVRHAAFVVGVSAFGRSQLLRWVDVEQWNKVQVVHCGLDPSFLDAPITPVPNTSRLVCVGRLSGQKGQLILLQAAAVLLRDGVPFELVLAGDGEMRGEIESSIDTLGLRPHVRITGWIDAHQVRQEILASRGMVLPSFAEGLPVVLMEAMALCRPVLTTYIAGIPELVQHGENGWLFPAGDVDALVAALKACLASPPAVLTTMGRSARDRACDRHNATHEAARLGALFKQAKSERTKEFL
jgi:colanic acid/amylovoran biosynthesis glycosyltransferase